MTLGSFSEYDELPVTSSEHSSSYVSYDTKLKKIRVRDIHRKEWTTLDLGVPCLLTAVTLNWDNENYKLLAQVEVWNEPGNGTRTDWIPN